MWIVHNNNFTESQETRILYKFDLGKSGVKTQETPTGTTCEGSTLGVLHLLCKIKRPTMGCKVESGRPKRQTGVKGGSDPKVSKYHVSERQSKVTGRDPVLNCVKLHSRTREWKHTPSVRQVPLWVYELFKVRTTGSRIKIHNIFDFLGGLSRCIYDF